MCRPNSNVVCAGKFFPFQTNVACADCLENTVICSGQICFLCSSPVQRTRTFQDSLESSKFRRSIDSAPSPALDEGGRDPILRGRTRSRTRPQTRPRRQRWQRMLQFCPRWAGRAAAAPAVVAAREPNIKLVALD
jgi:hypothetical protein